MTGITQILFHRSIKFPYTVFKVPYSFFTICSSSEEYFKVSAICVYSVCVYVHVG